MLHGESSSRTTTLPLPGLVLPPVPLHLDRSCPSSRKYMRGTLLTRQTQLGSSRTHAPKCWRIVSQACEEEGGIV